MNGIQGLVSHATSNGGKVSVTASSALMDDFIAAANLNDAREILVVSGHGQDNVIIYIRDSRIRCLIADFSSSSGWEEILLPPCNPQRICAWSDGYGKICAFTLDSGLALGLKATFSNDGGRTWAPWRDLSTDCPVRTAHVVNFAACSLLSGGPCMLFIVTDQISVDDGLWCVDWERDLNPIWGRCCAADGKVLAYGRIKGREGILFSKANSNSQHFELCYLPLDDLRSEAVTILIAHVESNYLAVSDSASGDDNYIVNARNAADRKTDIIEVMDGSVPEQGFKQIRNDIKATAVVTVASGTNSRSIFIMDQNNHLNVINCVSSQARWSDKSYNLYMKFEKIMPFIGARGNNGFAGWRLAHGLSYVWQSTVDDGTEAGPWNQVPFLTEDAKGKLINIPSYSTTLKITDINGAALRNQVVKVGASEFIPVTLAGKTSLIGTNITIDAMTDSAGRIRMTTPTDGLAICRYFVNIPEVMDEAEDMEIFPGAPIQTRLTKISDSDMKQLIPQEYQKDVAMLKRAIMNLAGAFSAKSGIPLIRARPQGCSTIYPSLAAPGIQPFRLSITADGIDYQPMTSENADDAILALTGGNIGYSLTDFENTVTGVINKAADAIKTTAEFIVNGAIVAMDIAIDGIHFLWHGVITLHEQAMKVIDTIFSAVKAGFERIFGFFGWLLTRASKDISATKDALDRELRLGLQTLASFADCGARNSVAFFAQFEKEIGNSFNEWEKAIQGMNNDQATNASLQFDGGTSNGTILDLMENFEAVSSWLMDKISALLASYDIKMTFPENAIQACKHAISNVIETFFHNIEGAVNTFVSKFQELASSSTSFGKTSLATMLEIAKEVTLLILKTVGSVIEQILLVIKEFLNDSANIILDTKIDIPIVNELFKLFGHKPPEVKVIDVVLLMCAFPATVLQKAIFDSVPVLDANDNAVLTPAERQVLSGFIIATNGTLYDILADVAPSPVWLPFLVFFPTTANLLVMPDFSQEDGNFLQYAGWGLGFAGAALTLVYAIASHGKQGPRSDKFGAGMLCGTGVLGLVCNIWRAASDSRLTIIENVGNIGGTASAIAKPLGLSPGKHAKVALGIIDFISDEALGVSRVWAGGKKLDKALTNGIIPT